MLQRIRTHRQIIIFLIFTVLLTACMGQGDEEPENIQNSALPGQEVESAASGGETPESVTDAFIAACVAGDGATAASYLTDETRQAAATLSGPCVGFDDARLQGEDRSIIESQIVGATAHVTWEWPEQNRFIPRYTFSLAQQPGGGWLISNGDPAGTLATPVPTPTIDVNVTSDLSMDSELTAEYDFPVPIGAEMGTIAQPGWTFHYTTGNQYTLDEMLNFYLYNLREAGWQIESSNVERVIDSSTEQIIAAGGRWIHDNVSASVNITLGSNGAVIVRVRLT